jgi:hypothetical protein
MKLEFRGGIFKKMFKYKSLGKSFQWKPSCSVRTDGRTDGHDEATVAFCNFANAPKSEKVTIKTRTKRSMG